MPNARMGAAICAVLDAVHGKVPGNHMPFGGLPSDADIDDVIAYLKDYK
jgi:cytochrome c2